MRAALEHLAARAGKRRRVAILGTMAELGPDAATYHEQIGALAADLGVEALLAVGEEARGLPHRREREHRDALGAGRGGGGAAPRRARAPGRRDPPEGLPLRRPRTARGEHRVMVRVLVAAIVAMLASIVVGPSFIEYLRRKEIGQHIREEGPAGTRHQAGNADHGRAPDHLLRPLPVPGAEPLHGRRAHRRVHHGRLRAHRLPGRLHQVPHRRSLGLAGRWKLVLLALITVVTGILAHHYGHYPTWVYVPALGKVQLGFAWYLLLFFVIAGSANGVNLTDGLDGLAAGTGIISIFTFMAMSVIAFIRSSAHPGLALDVAARPRALRGGADRRADRLPLVQRLPRRGVHGRHRLDGASAARSPASRS